MPEDSYQNKPLKYLVINYILDDIEHEWFGPEMNQERKRSVDELKLYLRDIQLLT